ncbi:MULTISPECIES: hypothetical protein [Caloranaerobacter]|uniref:hypothetical protein n=1 Tax=Caloranaerobacter TaxID=171003 RepID=UPI00159F26FE|nr:MULTISPECIES: hypothetical protein [Caloranaerobacter]
MEIHKENCPCPKKKCERFGKCEECREFHKKKNRLPYCERPKRGFLKLFRKS